VQICFDCIDGFEPFDEHTECVHLRLFGYTLMSPSSRRHKRYWCSMRPVSWLRFSTSFSSHQRTKWLSR